MERRMTDMKQRTLPRQSIGILYGCLMALQGVFYLQSPFPDRFDVGGKWEAPLCYSILFICLACIWFQNIWRRRAEWIRPKRIRWVLWIAGVMQVFPIYYWWQYDHITLYVGLSAIQPAPVCILFHILFAACTLGLLLGQRKYR